jgi:hypothetical protein
VRLETTPPLSLGEKVGNLFNLLKVPVKGSSFRWGLTSYYILKNIVHSDMSKSKVGRPYLDTLSSERNKSIYESLR